MCVVNKPYRFGFNGMEQDDEVKGNQNWLQFGDFGYDPRTARRNNTDPLPFPWISEYSVFNNNPIFWVDPEGLKPRDNRGKLGCFNFSSIKKDKLPFKSRNIKTTLSINTPPIGKGTGGVITEREDNLILTNIEPIPAQSIKIHLTTELNLPERLPPVQNDPTPPKQKPVLNPNIKIGEKAADKNIPTQTPHQIKPLPKHIPNYAEQMCWQCFIGSYNDHYDKAVTDITNFLLQNPDYDLTFIVQGGATGNNEEWNSSILLWGTTFQQRIDKNVKRLKDAVFQKSGGQVGKNRIDFYRGNVKGQGFKSSVTPKD